MEVCLKLLALLLTCHFVYSKEINIIVMVPGIDSFSNLVNAISYSERNDFVTNRTATTNKQANLSKLNRKDNDCDTFNVDELKETLNLSKCIHNSTKGIDLKCAIRVGNIITYPWSYIFVKPALDVALEALRHTHGLLNGYKINLKYYDSGDKRYGNASERRAQIASVDAMIDHDMVALIGPLSNYAMSRVVTFTSHWNILHVTPGATSSVLRTSNTEENAKNTMVRTGPTASQVGKCASSILKYYNWTSNALVLFGDDLVERYNYFMGEAIYMTIQDDISSLNLNHERITEFSTGDEPISRQNLLEFIRFTARVLFICLDSNELKYFLSQAVDFGFNEEYVFIIIDLEDKLGPRPWNFFDNLKKNAKLKRMFRSAIVITVEKNVNPNYIKFVTNLKEKLGRNLNSNLDKRLARKLVNQLVEIEEILSGAENTDDLFEKNQYPAYFYDSLLTLAHVFNKSLSRKTSVRWNSTKEKNNTFSYKSNASHLLEQYIANNQFEGVTGKLLFDNDGDRIMNFATLRYDPTEDKMIAVGHYDGGKDFYEENLTVPWPNGFTPNDVPKCGFRGEKCEFKYSQQVKVVGPIIVAFIVMVICFGIWSKCKQERLKKELESQLWKVSWSDITCSTSPNSPLTENATNNRWMGCEMQRLSETDPSLSEVLSYYVPSLSPSIHAKRAVKRKRKWSSNSKKNERVFDNERKSSTGSLISDKVWGGYTTIGLYKGKTVVIKFSQSPKVVLTTKVLMELKHMRDVTHEHLTRFVGACIDSPHVCILTEYCGKGSLKDILQNDEIKMDWMFRVSLMNDLVKGMSFLHSSAIHYHGNLKSTNCVVDSRFVLKITDYGLHAFRCPGFNNDPLRECEKKFWTAPELLRRSGNVQVVRQKADVYSFGIILQEIALRKGPFYIGNITLTCKEIIARVRHGCKPYFRPLLDASLSEDICNLMQKCWHEDPNERPDFTLTKKIIERFNRENPGNLVENLLHRMEQYAINLEGLVEERTAAYMEEKRKADELLYQMLPVPVVNRLKRGDPVPAEAFESVTICFTDIVGFTALSATSSPMQIVDLLNDLYTCFDGIIENYDVYKVETIGDAYMLVSGLPVRNGMRHAREIARTTLHLLKSVSNFKIRHKEGDNLKLRIGIHTGACCAGVVGLKMPRYCLFGDTVNTASRLESSGLPLSIHVSESTKQILDKFRSFKLQLRGDIPLKGKGTVTTYWLLGETSTELQSLDENEILT